MSLWFAGDTCIPWNAAAIFYVVSGTLYLYSSIRKFVIEVPHEKWYMTNNNQFTVVHRDILSYAEYLSLKLTQTILQHQQILYTALNLPSLIFALYKSDTDSPSLEFAHSPIFFTYSFTYKSIGPILNSPSGQRAKRVKIKRGRNFPCIQYYQEEQLVSFW